MNIALCCVTVPPCFEIVRTPVLCEIVTVFYDCAFLFCDGVMGRRIDTS